MLRRRQGSLAGARAAAVAEERLAAFARQWLPTPAVLPAEPPEPDGGLGRAAWAAVRDEPTDRGRIRLGPWSGSALRGLVLLLGVAVVIAGYWMWSGRPRAVAVPPQVIASGVPLVDTGAPGAEGVPADPSTAPGSTASESTAPPVPTDGVDPRIGAQPSAAVVVHVAGQVAHPGLVRLPVGSRVSDAIDAAGGVTRPRAADTVNLARILTDGEQVLVGVAGAGAGGGTGPATATSPVVDLNTAAASVLESLPGIGPVIAQRIVAWRTANGPFRSVEELGEVSGIGESILTQVRDLVRV